MDDDKLMKLVEERDVLYNRFHPYYKDVNKKEEAYAEIAEELDIPDVQLIIRRYHNLRDRYTRYKRLLESTGEARCYLPVMDKMEFLNPHIFSRKMRRKQYVRVPSDMDSSSPCDNTRTRAQCSTPQQKVSLRSDSDEDSMDPLQCEDELETVAEIPISLHEKSCEDKKASTIVINNDNGTSNRLKRKSETKSLQTGKKSTNSSLRNIDEEFSEAIQSFHRVCKAREERQKDGALQGFRQMIISTLADMSETKQTKAMLCVTEAVLKIKMEPEE
ncbi:uncharacterized protein LOC101891104 isoform X2 [Musca domestica]|uniref:Uncharacterized protein LOC101891104 isoform X2 n=1 Tax=Musca domestica TaxID=7370 RepID=A0ABM3V4B5_MUSDO|nr:uncharacterized protein LOC101891104 isoform X2 [Musca domestica]